jgi:gluconate kinase
MQWPGSSSQAPTCGGTPVPHTKSEKYTALVRLRLHKLVCVRHRSRPTIGVMNAVQIAGCSGAGKSAVAAVLARRGLVAIDSDDDPFLARFVDPAGAVVAETPAAPDLAWLARHSWAWDPARLDELIRAAAPATLYVCGGADNQHEVADRFTQVFLLEIDESTMLARLDARRGYHDWGRIGDTREYLRHKLPALQDRLRASGAVSIDARQPLDQVVDAILSAISAASAG